MANKKSKVSNVPNLRFPGFDGEWENYRLEEIAIFSKGKGISKSEIDNNGITKCIRYGELYTHYGEVIDEIKSRTNSDISTLVLSESNDVIIPASGETTIDIATASCVLKSGVALGGDLNIIKTKHNGVFLSYYLNSKKKLDIANLAQGISVVHLYSSQLASLSLNLPESKEQNKISTFLTLLSERIQTQSKIIEVLTVFKAAIAKKIFLQQLKFKDDDGKGFSEWKEICLENVCDIRKGEQFNKEELNETGLYPCLNGGISPSGFSKKYNSEENTITISEGGNSCGFVNFMTTKFWLGGHCYKILLSQKINLIYFYQLLKFNEKHIMNLRVGSGLPNIQMKSLKRFTIKISLSDNEQYKIANFLSSIDSKIDIETQLLKKLEGQKKFLLQNLFV